MRIKKIEIEVIKSINKEIELGLDINLPHVPNKGRSLPTLRGLWGYDPSLRKNRTERKQRRNTYAGLITSYGLMQMQNE